MVEFTGASVSCTILKWLRDVKVIMGNEMDDIHPGRCIRVKSFELLQWNEQLLIDTSWNIL